MLKYSEALKILSKYGQIHLLEYYEELSDAEKLNLLSDIEKTDFGVLENLREEGREEISDLKPITALSCEDIKKRESEFEKEGLKLLNEGKVGAVLLAAGQGTRLGFDKPKGEYDMGISKSISIFELQMLSVKETAKKSKPFHLFIMTSQNNICDTQNFFAEHLYFGYPKEYIHFFVQSMAPVCDDFGKVLLDEKYKICQSPNGNGGWYSSLIACGLNKLIAEQKIEWLNVYGVDNVLQKICDPVFIGATSLSGCASSSKVVKKVCAEEKTGVLCIKDGKSCVVEYYDMPERYKTLKDDKGELVFKYGVILNYLFKVEELNKAVNENLPYHVVKKAVPYIKDGVKVFPEKPQANKFETLIVDLIAKLNGCIAFEVVREREFAPVKNKTGADSVESARLLLKQNKFEI